MGFDGWRDGIDVALEWPEEQGNKEEEEMTRPFKWIILKGRSHGTD